MNYTSPFGPLVRSFVRSCSFDWCKVVFVLHIVRPLHLETDAGNVPFSMGRWVGER